MTGKCSGKRVFSKKKHNYLCNSKNLRTFAADLRNDIAEWSSW